MNRIDLIKIIFRYLSKLDYQKINIKKTIKEDLSPVTTIDIIHQYLIEYSIRYFYPNDKILTEEELRNNFSQKTIHSYKNLIDNLLKKIKNDFNFKNEKNEKSIIWHIDPLDGTKGFIDNLVYSVAIALTYENKIVGSGILSFNFNKINNLFPKTIMIIASSKMVEILDSNLTPLKTKNNIKNSNIIAISRKHKSNNIIKFLSQKNIKYLEIDSQAKYISIVLGLVDVYIREKGSCGKNFKDFTWDHLAGIHILKVNGNYVADYNNNPIIFKNNEVIFDKYIIASKNKIIYTKIKNFLKEFNDE
jgi:3'-phosphoadenosine 5'-phosphosulfate (PAPS) 3'-phosphatase